MGKTGEEFIEKTKFKYLGISSQMKGEPQPPIRKDLGDQIDVIDLPEPSEFKPVEWFVMAGPDLDAKNNFEVPANVVPTEAAIDGVTAKNGIYSINFAKLSWNVIRFAGS